MYESNCPLELDNLSKQHFLSGLAPVSFFLWLFLALLAHNSIPNPGIWIKVELVDTMHGFGSPLKEKLRILPNNPSLTPHPAMKIPPPLSAGVADSGSLTAPTPLRSHRGPGGTLQAGWHRHMASHRTQHTTHSRYLSFFHQQHKLSSNISMCFNCFGLFLRLLAPLFLLQAVITW